MITEPKQCQNCRNNFEITQEDFAFYSRIKVPTPTFCPDCRLQRRLAFRNERNLYRGECQLCHKSILTMYSPDKPYTVYCPECWKNPDVWDPMAYGRDYDFAKPFFRQFQALMDRVPRMSRLVFQNVINSDYANAMLNVKDLYMTFSSLESERVLYSRFVDYSKDICDCFNVKDSEKCYQTVDSAKNYNCQFLFRSRDCLDSSFLFDCVNCKNCFMSSNLRNAEYFFRNKKYSPDEYLKLVRETWNGSHKNLDELQSEFKALIERSLHKFANLNKTTDTVGNNIHNSNNACIAFDAYELDSVRYVARVLRCKDSSDITFARDGELFYELMTVGVGQNNQFDTFCQPAPGNLTYCDYIDDGSDCFGCVGLRKKSFCVLNRQYSKKEYLSLREKIIEQMNKMPFVDSRGRSYTYGEFFPIELSPFAYNETIAQEYFPLTAEQCAKDGYRWRDPDPYPHKPTIAAKNLPDNIRDVQDNILKEVIGCDTCGRAYKLIAQELKFLREHNLPLPRQCPECRYHGRFDMRPPWKLWHRKCLCAGADSDQSPSGFKYKNSAEHAHGANHCPNEFQTPYDPKRPEIVYCEQCYQSEII